MIFLKILLKGFDLHWNVKQTFDRISNFEVSIAFISSQLVIQHHKCFTKLIFNKKNMTTVG